MIFEKFPGNEYFFISISELDEASKKNENNAREYMADVHQNSSIHFLKKREMELEQKIENYKSQRIDLINLAEENKVPEIREKIVENKLLGIKNVPTFITKMDPELAGNVQYMKDYLIKMKNEVKIKTKIRDELLESKFDQSRVDRLLVSNGESEKRLVELESEVKLWRVANATKDYLDAISPNFINNNTDLQIYQKDDDTNLAPEEVIKMFLHNHQSFEQTAVCDPTDSQKAKEALKIITQFGKFIRNKEYHEAAKIGMTNKVLHSLNTLERIASGNTLDSYRAAIWFATVIFESKSQYCDKFVLRALEISKSANLTRKVLPHWHSLGIFKTVCSRFF